MKKTSLTLVLLFACFAMAFANDTAYENAMLSQLEKLKGASTHTEYQSVANAFERIGQMNTEAWHPRYYSALAFTQMAMVGTGTIYQKDALLDKAMDQVQKAAALSAKNSEIVALEGYILMSKLSLDPGSRGQSLSPAVLQTFGKANALDKNNPRALALMAQMENGMAQFFGQGPEKSCRLAKSSLDLFQQEQSTPPSDKLAPRWGIELAEGLVGKCE